MKSKVKGKSVKKHAPQTVIHMSSLIETGDLLGFQTGDSYDHMVAILGDPPYTADATFALGAIYGNLEIYFPKNGQGEVDRTRSELVYLNAVGSKRIRIKSRHAFRSDGLRWQMTPKEFCEWLINRRIPFEYKGDPNIAVQEAVIINLPDKEGRREVVFYQYEDGATELGELYFSAHRE